MKKTLLVIAISAFLTACGSGGGSSNSEANTTENTAGNSVNTPAVSTVPAADKKDTSLILNDIAKSEINQFVLNGKTVNLMPQGMNPGGFFMNNGGNIFGDTLTKAVSGRKYTETRFGILVPDDADLVAFSQGTVTVLDDMPTANVETKYSGDFVNYDKNKKSFNNGTVDVGVNFALKNIKIDTFDDQTGKKLGDTMTGSITGNQFTFDSGKGKGQFYGSQAAELSGIHKDGNVVTSFGAKKQ
ncbi:Transferrin binding protein-like solute binding protein [Phocoenobacter uteri]|uniref:Transferrin binding protein-like solute binding protein n=1 Tax=Phocoenobacter uteri TaxID=146806 RepID=A0A379DEV4_9PAST|nr:transferrin-binding protein-like solute binding protein [Phocoenobacter uteri]MDG6882775.1 hypothetical protein [Phocoenobacter uteri]SUB58942.1 Transferrin binding protein-like solute binding protein [Phocoenobacter uteri]SUB76447.1 Transferrin binding protein-like solute binding protein [Phocoenobacter uteri]